MTRKTTSRRRLAAISHDSSERSHILEDRMIPPLVDVDALRAFELRELREFARALPGVVIPLGGLVDFISGRRRGILIRPVRSVVGVETTHDVGRDGRRRPLQALGGPPPPFHPREVRS